MPKMYLTIMFYAVVWRRFVTGWENSGSTDIFCAIVFCCVQNKWTYPGFEGNQFKDHLHCEQSSEEHVEDVHRVVKTFGLSMMLQKHSY